MKKIVNWIILAAVALGLLLLLQFKFHAEVDKTGGEIGVIREGSQ